MKATDGVNLEAARVAGALVTEGGQQYMQFDRIVITEVGGAPRISYLWQDVEVAWMQSAAVVMLPTARIGLGGFVGRLGVL